MRKRVLALVMGLMMSASVLAGCGSGGTGENTEAAASVSAESTAAESTAAQSTEGTADTADKELVDLRLIFYGDMSSRREEFFKNEFHDAVLEDLNINLTVEFLPWGSDTNVSTMLASGERICQWSISYPTMTGIPKDIWRKSMNPCWKPTFRI